MATPTPSSHLPPCAAAPAFSPSSRLHPRLRPLGSYLLSHKPGEKHGGAFSKASENNSVTHSALLKGLYPGTQPWVSHISNPLTGQDTATYPSHDYACLGKSAEIIIPPPLLPCPPALCSPAMATSFPAQTLSLRHCRLPSPLLPQHTSTKRLLTWKARVIDFLNILQNVYLKTFFRKIQK